MTPAGYQHIDYLRRFRVIAYMLVALSVLGLGWAEGSPFTLGLGLTGCALSWWLVETPGAVPMPRWLINTGVVLASLLLFWGLVILGQENVLQGLGHFMVGILVCKLFESKQNRDYAQILTLSLLIMVAAAIFSPTLTFGLLLAVYLSLSVYAILIFHLRFDTDRALAAGSAPAELIMSAERQRRLRRDVRRMALRVGIVVMLFAAAVFVLFPRSTSRDVLGAQWLGRGNLQTGFTERVEFGEFTRMLRSEAPAMEVRVDVDGTPYAFDREEPYFRGVTYDRYSVADRKRMWQQSIGVPKFLPSPEALGEIPDASFRQQYKMLASTGTVLFSLAGEPAGYRTIPALAAAAAELQTDVGESRRVTLSPLDFTLRTEHRQGERNPSGQLEYAVITPRTAPGAAPHGLAGAPYVDYRQGFLDPQWMQEQGSPPDAEMFDALDAVLRDIMQDAYERSVRLTEGTARVVESAEQRLTRARSGMLRPDEALWLAGDVAEYLRTNYKYTLTSKNVEPGLDPVVDFLKNRKGTEAGHCEHFASGFVLLCRVAGLNARMVTGYHGGEYNSLGQYLLVRQKHAHAWAEVYIEGQGWQMFDPSPAGVETPASWHSAWLKQIREFFQMVQSNWLSRIVAFDASTRKYLIDAVGTAIGDLWQWAKDTSVEAWSGVKEMIFSKQSNWQARIAATIGLTWVALAGMWLVRQWHRRRTSHVAAIIRNLDPRTQRQLEHELVFFDELLRMLGRAGETKRTEHTPREYVEALGQRLGSAKADALWLVDLFYAIRFGLVHITPATEGRIQTALSRVRQEMAGGH